MNGLRIVRSEEYGVDEIWFHSAREWNRNLIDWKKTKASPSAVTQTQSSESDRWAMIGSGTKIDSGMTMNRIAEDRNQEEAERISSENERQILERLMIEIRVNEWFGNGRIYFGNKRRSLSRTKWEVRVASVMSQEMACYFRGEWGLGQIKGFLGLY